MDLRGERIITSILLTMPLALVPNLKEDRVSAALSVLAEQHMISAILALPPKESCTSKQKSTDIPFD